MAACSPGGRGLGIGILELLKHRPTDAIVAFAAATILGALGSRYL